MKENAAKVFLAVFLFEMVTQALPSLAFDKDAAQEAFDTLKAARSLKCTFSNGTAADWSGGLMNIKNDNESMVHHFDAIDWKQGTARSIGNQGASNETVFMTPKGLTFIEQTNSGNFTFTTVFNLFKKGTNAFIAVTSRHMNMMLTPIPSQYHGTCVVWPSQ